MVRPYQDVKIIELALGHISIEEASQGWALVGESLDPGGLHAIEDPA
jgi:hypothetical protein